MISCNMIILPYDDKERAISQVFLNSIKVILLNYEQFRSVKNVL
jgi:hypothetical protein